MGPISRTAPEKRHRLEEEIMTRLQVYRPYREMNPFRDIWKLPEEFNRLFWGLNRATPEEADSAEVN